VSGPEFAILFVCTGNVCRSPFAAALTRHLLDDVMPQPDAARIVIASAGTRAPVGAAIHPATRAELAGWGVTGPAVDGHYACQVDAALLSVADLVLTAERHHRALVVQAHPEALRTTFCLREFHRLLSTVDHLAPADPVARLHAAVAEVTARRGTIPPVPPDQDAVPDPYGGPAAAHRHSATMLGGLVRDIVARLFFPARQPCR
jgi:low molecular weight protein-tyrosine phosphatase